MEKRVDRNKDLYNKIDKLIEEKKKNYDNPSFNSTQSALSSINPDLFGQSETKKPTNPVKKSNKKTLIGIVVGIVLAVLIIILVVTLL